jgi:hypothetical protein
MDFSPPVFFTTSQKTMKNTVKVELWLMGKITIGEEATDEELLARQLLVIPVESMDDPCIIEKRRRIDFIVNPNPSFPVADADIPRDRFCGKEALPRQSFVIPAEFIDASCSHLVAKSRKLAESMAVTILEKSEAIAKHIEKLFRGLATPGA